MLALEYTEAAFYQEALERGACRAISRSTPRSSWSTRRPTSRSSSRRWGAAAEPAPRHEFGDRTKDAEAFTAAAVKLEDLAVATYNGQAVNLTPASLKAAARIVSVEGRHAAWIRSIVGDVPATEATDPAIKEAETRAAADRLRLEGGVSRMDFLLDDLDTDGALREAGENAGISRATFLGGTVAGAVAAFAIAPTAEAAGSQDVAVLNFALVLEYLQSSFYTEAERSKALRGKAEDAATRVGAVERAHVAAFKELLGRKAVKRPAFDFRGTTEAERPFLKTAVAFEDLAVAAYKGQAPRLRSKPVLAAAVAIHSVEARHAAWMRFLFGVQPAVNAFDDASPKAEVQRLVAATHFVVARPRTKMRRNPRFTG